MSDREIVNRVKDATDIVALVGQSVKLRKQGSSWTGLCPFHSERTPSFQVVPSRQFYHCFGCGQHGDVFSWLQEREGMTFPEALEVLAKQAGIDLPRYQEQRAPHEIQFEDRMRAALEEAWAFYRGQLAGNPQAQSYLVAERGLSASFLETAGLGWAPEGWEILVEHLKRQGFSAEVLEQSGLATRSERGNLVDFLRGRITIPIRDARGRVVAFGGRAWADAKPKYLNTRDTPIFHKGQTLFGFERAKGGFANGALVVEGYFDVLQLQQQGIQEAVAPLGTSLTEDHLRMIQRYTKVLILCFDGDEAGHRAMERSVRLALPMGFDVRLLELPQGQDPDTWCLQVGSEGFRKILGSAPDWTRFILDRAMAGKDLRRVQDRLQAFRELSEYLIYLPQGTLETREVLSALAYQIEMPVPEIERALEQRRKGKAVGPSDRQPAPAEGPAVEVADSIRKLVLLCRNGLGSVVLDLPQAWWESLPGAPILQWVLDAEEDGGEIPEAVLAHVRRMEAEASLRDDLTAIQHEPVIYQLELDYVERERQALIRDLGDPKIQANPEMQAKLEKAMAEALARKSRIMRNIRSLRGRM